MSDFAFNNYCIHCDKLCLNNSVYCSEECKSIAYESSLNQLQHNHNTTSTNGNTNTNTSASATTSTSTTTGSSVNSTNSNTPSLVSPLLTPALYIQLQQQQQLQQLQQSQINTPLHLSSLTPTTDYNNEYHYEYDNDIVDNDDDELNYFDLNYSVQSNINYTTNTTKSNNELINSTSDNYRKWLTAL